MHVMWLLSQLSRKLYENGIVKDSFEESVIKREREFSTGLPLEGYKAALPHTDEEHVNSSALCIASMEEPVEFRVMGSPKETVPVSVVIMLAIKESSKQL